MGQVAGHHVRAAWRRKHAAGPPTGAPLPSTRPAPVHPPRSRPPAPLDRDRRRGAPPPSPQGQVPPQAAGPTRHGPRGEPRAAARASVGGAPLRPVTGVSPHQSEALLPLPAPSPEVLPRRIHYQRGTCRSSSLRYEAAKNARPPS